MTPTRRQIDRILCPVDFSEATAPAVEHSLRLARWFDARVEVLHVLPLMPFGMAGGGVPDIPEAIRVQREAAARELAILLHPLLDQGVPIEAKLLDGDTWRVILDEAGAWPATDLNDASHGTLDAALSLAKESDAQVTLLHVIASLPGEADRRASAAIPDAPLRVDLTEQAQAQLRHAVPDTARQFCGISERVETGTPWSEILRVAREWDADLIVVGAHARSAVGRALSGSTASHIVRGARCPVLVVRGTQKGEPSARAREAEGWLSVV